METKVYTIDHLGCANCAAKMEDKINQIPGVEATITFATRQLRVTAEAPEALLEQMQKIVSSIEPDARITQEHHHDHHHHEQERCGCEHHHDHHHEHCDCGHDHHEHHHENNSLLPLVMGAVLFVAGIVLDAVGVQVFGLPVSVICYVAAYLVLGWQVLFAAGKNLVKGHVFDENFLMSIATLGAFVIREFP